jgi:hypothetical protein
MRGTEVECPGCARKVIVQPPKRTAPPPQQTAPPHDIPKHGPTTFWNMVLLFAVITGGVYCGERLFNEFHSVSQQSLDVQYDYRIDVVDPEHTFFSAGRDLVEAEMNRYRGDDGWDLKAAVPAVRKGETQLVLIYSRLKAPESPELRAVKNARMGTEIQQAITNLSNQRSEREKWEFEMELKRIRGQ